METTEQYREYLTTKLMRQRPDMATANNYYEGRQGLSYLDPDIAAKMQGRLRSMTINFAQVAIEAVASRLTVAAFATSPGGAADEELWAIWQRQDMDEQSAQAMQEALIAGRSFFMCWVGPDGQPSISAESPLQCAIHRDPLTRETVAGIKRYVDDEGYSRSIVFTRDEVVQYVSSSADVSSTFLGTTDTLQLGEDVRLVSREPNPLGMVPLIALVNRPRLMQPDGSSDLAALYDPIDGIAKLSTDMMVAAEYSASPRRYATGIAPDGITPEQMQSAATLIRQEWEKQAASKFILAANDKTQIGQLDVASLTNYETAIQLLSAQIAAIAALPPTYVGLTNSANPASADALRASEARLVARIRQRQGWFSGAFESLMRMAVTIQRGTRPTDLDDLQTIWDDPSPITLSQVSDSVTKLYASGILDRRAALTELGLSPLEVDRNLAESPAQAALPASVRRVVRDAEGNIESIVESQPATN